LSSQYPSGHGAEISGPNKHLDEEPVRDIRDDVSILSDTLREAGFETALFSANPYLGGKLERRFDHAIVNRQPTPALNAKALAWLDQLEGRRFFMHLQYMDLHQPIRPPKQYFNMFPISDATRRGKAHTVWPRRFTRVTNPSDPRFKSFRNHKIALYDGALRYVDGEIGKFLAALRERGLRSQTLFVITSDHGEEFWEHAEIERALGGDPRKIWGVAHGHSMFQELLSVPLIFAGPRVPSGRRLSCPAGTSTLYPRFSSCWAFPGRQRFVA
jgi:membrane-anchored protein YejM (alkaline phosphatase superfamily)